MLLEGVSELAKNASLPVQRTQTAHLLSIHSCTNALQVGKVATQASVDGKDRHKVEDRQCDGGDSFLRCDTPVARVDVSGISNSRGNRLVKGPSSIP